MILMLIIIPNKTNNNKTTNNMINSSSMNIAAWGQHIRRYSPYDTCGIRNVLYKLSSYNMYKQ